MPSAQILTVDNTLGAAYIGVIVAAFLFGVSCIQAFHYFTHQNDDWSIKGLVSAVMILDTVHQVLISHTVYTYLITDFGNHPALQSIVWSLLVEVIFNGLTTLLVQSFMTARVWRLSNRNVWLVGLIVMLVVGEFFSTVAYTCMSLRLHTFSDLAHLKTLSITVNALGAGGDLLIAVALCTILHKSRTGFHGSNTMINKLIVYTVNTGCITSVCALASTISILAAGETFIYIAFYFCIGRLYSNSLLATLNARDKIRSASSRSQTDDVVLPEIPKTTTFRSSIRSFPIIGRPGSPIAFSRDLEECVKDGDSGQGLGIAMQHQLDCKSSLVRTFPPPIVSGAD